MCMLLSERWLGHDWDLRGVGIVQVEGAMDLE
jgi:hypothetical protein